MHHKPQDCLGFPFKTRLSFKLLIERWKASASGCDGPGMAGFAADLIKRLEQVPELQQDAVPAETAAAHGELVRDLLLPLIPLDREWAEPEAVADPFSNTFIYTNSAFAALLGLPVSVGDSHNLQAKVVYAYRAIFEQFYGFEPEHNIRLQMEFGTPGTGENRVFEMIIDKRYAALDLHGELPEFSDAQLVEIRKRFDDPEYLASLLPPEMFDFYGVIALRAHDITVRVRLEQLKNSILDRGSILNRSKFLELQEQIRLLIGCEEAALAVAAVQDERVLLLNSGLHDGTGCIFAATEHFPLEQYRGSLFAEALESGQTVIIDDLQAKEEPTALEQMMAAHGKRNIYAAPLQHGGGSVGVFSLSSDRPGRIDALNSALLTELLPLFAYALQRSLDEFDDRIQHVIQDRFTAIHPAVHWRFRKEAVAIMERINSGQSVEDPSIVFDNIYPLYSVTDIRGSSAYRNSAIQTDLVEHLEAAKLVLEEAYRVEPLPIYDETVFRIDGYLALIRERLSTGDELQVINFLRGSVESCFENMTGYTGKVTQLLEEYRAVLDPSAGTVYRRRKEYDESVAEINRSISSFLDRINPEAQRMYPHYFDKQATDGVDQNIYLGESLVENRPFSRIHLQNMRLWQLITMCRIALRMEVLKERLPVPLETTHLIMVQDMPISIRFDSDEKKFRVDGAYNIRYEIMKKRIDKAVIRGTGERLTQPGTVAIVYSHNEEIVEYLGYIRYLQSRGVLLDAVAEFELEDLQGIHGLKALRVTVNTDPADSFEQLFHDALSSSPAEAQI